VVDASRTPLPSARVFARGADGKLAPSAQRWQVPFSGTGTGSFFGDAMIHCSLIRMTAGSADAATAFGGAEGEHEEGFVVRGHFCCECHPFCATTFPIGCCNPPPPSHQYPDVNEMFDVCVRVSSR
jgi:hypothetical protein